MVPHGYAGCLPRRRINLKILLDLRDIYLVYTSCVLADRLEMSRQIGSGRYVDLSLDESFNSLNI
jgi:hypothetical protein